MAYHPQTNSLTERKNQWVEQYLHLIIANQEDWAMALLITTLVHNNTKNGTMGFSLNELLIGREPPTIISQGEGTQNLLTEQRVKKLRQQQILTTQALNKVAEKLRLTETKWSLWQKVWLEAKNLALPYGTIKLAPKHYGPFKILKVLSPVTYKLELPFQWTIHPMFHTSLLTPYVKTMEHGENFLRPPPNLINNDEQYEVKTICSHRCHRRRKQLQYLIKWTGYLESNNMWEPVKNIQAPSLIKQYHKHRPLKSIKTN